MIRGRVNAGNEAVVRLRLRGTGGTEIEVDAVVDSGFTAEVTLTPSTLSTLNLVPVMKTDFAMADGTVRKYDIFPVQVFWNGVWQRVLASALGPNTLIGMGLLAGHALMVEVRSGGAVVIDPLP